MSTLMACPDCAHAIESNDGVPLRRSCPACGAALPGCDLVDEEEPPITFRRREVSADESEMDMTPMVDVTFLLLIFFIMTAAFSLQKAIEIPPTEEETAQNRTLQDFDEDQDYVIVRVDADNVFWVSSPAEDREQEAPSEVELLAQLRAARTPRTGQMPPRKMLVLASGDARHEFVVMALDAGTAVGMEEVKWASDEDE